MVDEMFVNQLIHGVLSYREAVLVMRNDLAGFVGEPTVPNLQGIAPAIIVTHPDGLITVCIDATDGKHLKWIAVNPPLWKGK